MPEYDLTIRVHDEEKLAVIISALKGAGTLLTVAPVSEFPQGTGRLKIRRRRGNGAGTDHGGERHGTSSVAVALLKVSPGGRASRHQIEAALEAAGYSASSLSPTMSALTRSGTVRRVGNGHTFELVPVVAS
jgi:DNA-binding IclR family transcriptional regulator